MSDPRHFSDTVLVAVVTALSYALAYAYRTGFSSHFGVPPVLMSPTTGAVLQAAPAVGIVLLGYWNIANVVWMFAPSASTALSRSFRRITVIGLFVGLLCFSALERTTAWITFTCVVALFAAFEFLFPLATQRGVPGYEQKLLAQEAIEWQAQKRTLLENVAVAFGEHFIQLALWVLVLLFLSHAIGLRAAKEKEDFYVLADQPGYVVVVMDEEIAALAAYDPVTHTLNRSYKVLRLSDAGPWTIRLEHIGKLAAPPSIQSQSTHGNP